MLKTSNHRQIDVQDVSQSCVHCRAYRPNEINFGECRNRSPRASNSPDKKAYWPLVLFDQWCCEFEVSEEALEALALLQLLRQHGFDYRDGKILGYGSLELTKEQLALVDSQVFMESVKYLYSREFGIS